MSEKSPGARASRKTRTGVVVSDKMQKTVTVLLERRFAHPIYGKQVTRSKRVKARNDHEARAGDTVRVMVRVREGDKERLQAFEGVVIARRGGGISENFTVRKVSAGVGVERMFRSTAPRSPRSSWCAADGCAAPSSITCVR